MSSGHDGSSCAIIAISFESLGWRFDLAKEMGLVFLVEPREPALSSRVEDGVAPSSDAVDFVARPDAVWALCGPDQTWHSLTHVGMGLLARPRGTGRTWHEIKDFEKVRADGKKEPRGHHCHGNSLVSVDGLCGRRAA
jgi:hypothetical protein